MMIQAYLAGANYEMNRELLWREFPTTQRSSAVRPITGQTAKEDPTQNDAGWFITFEEQAGEPVFGADEVRTEAQQLVMWYDLGWNDIFNGETQTKFINVNKSITVNDDDDEKIIWGRNSADQAYANYQNPSRIFIHASDLLN